MTHYEGDTVFLVLGNAANCYADTTEVILVEGCTDVKENNGEYTAFVVQDITNSKIEILKSIDTGK